MLRQQSVGFGVELSSSWCTFPSLPFPSQTQPTMSFLDLVEDAQKQCMRHMTPLTKAMLALTCKSFLAKGSQHLRPTEQLVELAAAEVASPCQDVPPAPSLFF